MQTTTDLKMKVLMAARDNGIASIVFRNAMAKKLGLNLTESLCLTKLGTTGAATPTELAKFTGLTGGATTTMLDRLEQKGFIVRMANPHDRRGVIIDLGENYTKTAHKLVAGIQKANNDLISSYAEHDLKVIVDFLTKFTENMAKQTEVVEGLGN